MFGSYLNFGDSRKRSYLDYLGFARDALSSVSPTNNLIKDIKEYKSLIEEYKPLIGESNKYEIIQNDDNLCISVKIPNHENISIKRTGQILELKVKSIIPDDIFDEKFTKEDFKDLVSKEGDIEMSIRIPDGFVDVEYKTITKGGMLYIFIKNKSKNNTQETETWI